MSKRHYNRTNTCDICGNELITNQKPRREIDKEGNWTGRWLCKKCYREYQKNNSINQNNIMEPLIGKYCRFILCDKTWNGRT